MRPALPGARSDNNITPIGTFTDSFETSRVIASGKISGHFEYGEVKITPELSVAWFEETQDGYTDTLTNFISEQTISLGEIKFGPEFSRTYAKANGGSFTPSFGIKGVYNFGIKNNTASQGFALGNDDLRARLNAGISTTNDLGWILALTGFYDGLGLSDYKVYGGREKATITVN